MIQIVNLVNTNFFHIYKALDQINHNFLFFALIKNQSES